MRNDDRILATCMSLCKGGVRELGGLGEFFFGILVLKYLVIFSTNFLNDIR